MTYKKIVNENKRILEKKLKRHLNLEEYTILLTKIYKDTLCKNPTSISSRLYDFFEIYYPELTLKYSKEKIASMIYKKQSFDRKNLANKWVREKSFGVEIDVKQRRFLESLLIYLNPKLKWKKKTKAALQNQLKKEISENIQHLFPKTAVFLKNDILLALLLEKSQNKKNLALKSSNYIQLLGAETSFFNLGNPKHGLIFNHDLVQKSEHKGKTSRKLSNELSILIKEDYFK